MDGMYEIRSTACHKDIAASSNMIGSSRNIFGQMISGPRDFRGVRYFSAR